MVYSLIDKIDYLNEQRETESGHLGKAGVAFIL